MILSKQSLRNTGIRLILAWIALSALGAWRGSELVTLLMPMLGAASDAITTDFSALLQWDETNPSMLTIAATFDAPNPAIQAMGINVGARVRAGTNIEHVLIPVVLVYAVLCSWPVARTGERLALLVLGVPAAVLGLVLTTPFLLAGKVESLLQVHAAKAGLARPEPFHLNWMIFTEAGGRWLIPIILGVCCVWIVAWFGARRDART